jgi:hypothetical protein
MEPKILPFNGVKLTGLLPISDCPKEVLESIISCVFPLISFADDNILVLDGVTQSSYQFYSVRFDIALEIIRDYNNDAYQWFYRMNSTGALSKCNLHIPISVAEPTIIDDDEFEEWIDFTFSVDL